MKNPRTDTKIISLGRHGLHDMINPPVCHASTITYPTVAELESRDKRKKDLTYGLHGTPTTFALEEAVTELEGGHDCRLFPSGLAAIAAALMAYLSAGDHLLMVDSVYGPSRRFCDQELSRFGVETTYYDPLIGAGIAELIRPETRVVYVESPGSNSFDIQDIPAIAAEAHKRDCLVLMDNAWATPLFFRPFEKGVDVSIQPGTKYLAGHGDVMMGAVITTEAAWKALDNIVQNLGQNISPDDAYLALRGMRTLSVRLERHQANALELAKWLKERQEVTRVLHPALPDNPGHELWKRDFSGSSGLFGVELKPASKEAVAAMLDGMDLFKMGYSWGGYESLIVPCDPGKLRAASEFITSGPCLRIHAGLEDPEDMKEDLAAGFERLNAYKG